MLFRSVIQESRSLQSEIDTVKNADAVNSLCTVNTVHGLRDCRKDGKPIQCPILLTFS